MPEPAGESRGTGQAFAADPLPQSGFNEEDHGPRLGSRLLDPPFITSDEILLSDSQILEDLKDRQKACREFDQMMKEKAVDLKYLGYQDRDSLAGRARAGMRAAELLDGEPAVRSKAFQPEIAATIQGMLEDKFSDMEKVR